MVIKNAPVASSFFLVSLLGFFIAAAYIPQFSLTWAVAFSILFLVMFFSSLLQVVRVSRALKKGKKK